MVKQPATPIKSDKIKQKSSKERKSKSLQPKKKGKASHVVKVFRAVNVLCKHQLGEMKLNQSRKFVSPNKLSQSSMHQ